MDETITLELPRGITRSVKEVAARIHRPPEELVLEWIDQATTDLPVEWLPDDQVLALADLQMNEVQQQELSQLLAENREGTLDPARRTRLDQLLQIYRRGLVRKAQALKVAVDPSLRPPLLLQRHLVEKTSKPLAIVTALGSCLMATPPG